LSQRFEGEAAQRKKKDDTLRTKSSADPHKENSALTSHPQGKNPALSPLLKQEEKGVRTKAKKKRRDARERVR